MNLMIDFETLGTTPDSVILSIGACLFDVNTGVSGNTFYQVVDVDTQTVKGRTVSADTIKWWMGQSKEAQKVFSEPSLSFSNSILKFQVWLGQYVADKDKLKVWGNGFDVAMMENAIRQCGHIPAWHFRNIRCLRTFKEYVAKNAGYSHTVGIAHNALDDAINQANYVIKHSKGKL